MKRQILNKIPVFWFLAILAGLYLFLMSSPFIDNSYADVPNGINYQGILTDKDNKFLEGSYALVFGMYDSQTGGNNLWEETHSSVQITKGVFSVLLGSAVNLNLAFDKAYFLQIQVNGETLSPRQQIASLGYAYRASYSGGGFPKGAIVMWSGSVSSIPAGWTLCNGSNGAPDLRDRFIAGAGGSFTQTGGAAEVTLGVTNLPSHSHFNSSHTHTRPATHTHKCPLHQHAQVEHTHSLGDRGALLGKIGGYDTSLDWMKNYCKRVYIGGGGGDLTGSAGDIDTASSGADSISSSGNYATSYEGASSPSSVTNIPPYYALAFIMKL